MVGGYILKVINILRLSEVYLDNAFQFRGHMRITCRTFLPFTIPSPWNAFFFFLICLFLAVSGLSYPAQGLNPPPPHWKTGY